MRPVSIPDHDPAWHPIAIQLYLSLAESGQCDYYQSSDWAFAHSVCDDLSYVKLQGQRRSAQMLQTIYTAMERLLVSEGDRRRVRIELQQPQPEETPASVVAIAQYRADLGLSG